MLNTKFRGQEAYATSDILVPHPTKPGRWKITGRADDQIMLSNGEKVRLYFLVFNFIAYSRADQTNPGPLGKNIIISHVLQTFTF
jgi:hypothetical protein